jgi:hypothetical protein
MSLENWIVRNRSGEPLGVIRKLVLDSRTHRIVYAEMSLWYTRTVLRIPWEDLELDHDAFVLDGTIDDIAAFYYTPFRNAAATTEVEGFTNG